MFSVINGVITEGVNDEQYGLSDYRGGIIVFSTDVNALKMSNNVIINKVKQTLLSFSNRLNKNKILGNIVNKFNKEQEGYIGAFSIGKYFKGRYVSDNGKIYNETSTTIEINRISSINLLKIAEFICQEFKQETVLVKDLNLNKIYLANPNKSVDFDLSNVNTQSQL